MANNPAHADTAGPIQCLATECIDLFNDALRGYAKGLGTVSNEENSQKYRENSHEDLHRIIARLAECHEAFEAWLSFASVFAGSDKCLEYRIRTHKATQDIIIRLLEVLRQNLFFVSCELTQKVPDLDEDSVVSIALAATADVLRDLNKLVLVIRQSSRSSALTVARNFANVHSGLKHFESLVLVALEALYPNIPESLRKHLCNTLTDRYARLEYDAHRRGKKRKRYSVQVHRVEGTKDQKKSQPAQQGHLKKMEIPIQSLGTQEVSEMPQEMVLSSIDTKEFSRNLAPEHRGTPRSIRTLSVYNADTTIHEPELPRLQDMKTEVECDWCGKMLDQSMLDNNSWSTSGRLHYRNDLKPWPCPSEACGDSRPSFSSRKEFFNHMRSRHASWLQSFYQEPMWVCDSHGEMVLEDNDSFEPQGAFEDRLSPHLKIQPTYVFSSTWELERHISLLHHSEDPTMEPRLVDNLGEVFLTSEVTDSDVCPLCWLVLRDRVPMPSDEAHEDSSRTPRSGKQLKVDKKATVTFDDDAKQASDADHHDLHHGNHDDFKIELHVANHLQYLMVLSLRLAEAMNDESSQVTGGSGSKLINECSSVDKSGINGDTFSEGGLIYLSDIELEELQKIRDANEATEIAMLAAESPPYGSDSPLSTLTVSRDTVAFDSKEYTVGWICAIPLEMAAARGMLDKIHPRLSRQDHNDHNNYILGEIHGHKIVIACLPVGEYGSSSAASVARDLLLTFTSIHTCLLVGIGSGAPSPQHDIRLGDVVIGQPSATTGGVVQYDLGKSLPQDKFQPTSTHNMTPQLLITALAHLEATHMTTDSRVPEFLAQLVAKSPEGMKSRFKHPETANDLLYEPNYNHANPEDGTCEKCDESKICRREERQDIDPYFHYGIIASGNHIVKDGKTREFLSQQFNALCFDMEAAGLMDLPCLVIRGICDYADSHRNQMWQGYAAATAAAFAKELMLFVTPNQVLQQKKLQPEHVSIAKDNLEALMVTSNEKGYMEETVNNRPIDLYTVLNARYDSEDVRNSPRCQPGTRLRILETIEQWAVQGMSQPVFWLIGPTGTGKSTIARSIVDALDKDKRLAAGYFFKRGDEDRNDTNRLFSTLAMQFADNVSSFKESLRKELEGLDKDAVDEMNLETQFQKLLLCPLENLQLDEKDHLERTIIIDALDECERPENFLRLLELFSKLCTTSKLCLRVLITSRSAPEIVEAFESHLRNGTVHALELHRKFAEDTKADIRKFLRTRFEDIRHKRRIQQYPWPNIEELDRLVELSTTPEPLFIYAATLCRFVSDRQRGPTRQLTIWLKQGNKSQLQQIYTPILDQAFAGFDEEEFSQKLRFLGAITLSKKPLSAKALAIILGIDLDDISWWLPRLYAVLHAPPRLDGPIELVHTSFKDFLVSSDDLGSHKYQINAAEIHADLAKAG